MEDEFWEIDRAESGQLSRICMDHQLIDRDIHHPGLRRILRERWRQMNGVLMEARQKKLEEARRRGSARH